MKTIVVSAVNLVTGGTLSILQDCLKQLSDLSTNNKEYKVIAIVHHKDICSYPNIEYVELEWPKTAWMKRVWCEYVTFHSISKNIGPVYLWLSLHDLTPNVIAERQAVYCHNSFPFFRYTWKDFLFYKPIILFVNLTNLFYRININKNRYVIVQQDLMRKAFIEKFKLSPEKIIVAPPNPTASNTLARQVEKNTPFLFIYASAPGIQKNFETVCQAAKELEQEIGKEKFKVLLTINGKENTYSRWIYENYGTVESVDFKGWISKEELYGYYQIADCMIFASRIESWGLPISEFKVTGKPMILANEPYSWETSANSRKTTFFNTLSVLELKEKMRNCLNGNLNEFQEIPKPEIKAPFAEDWKELIHLLIY